MGWLGVYYSPEEVFYPGGASKTDRRRCRARVFKTTIKTSRGGRMGPQRADPQTVRSAVAICSNTVRRPRVRDGVDAHVRIAYGTIYVRRSGLDSRTGHTPRYIGALSTEGPSQHVTRSENEKKKPTRKHRRNRPPPPERQTPNPAPIAYRFRRGVRRAGRPNRTGIANGSILRRRTPVPEPRPTRSPARADRDFFRVYLRGGIDPATRSGRGGSSSLSGAIDLAARRTADVYTSQGRPQARAVGRVPSPTIRADIRALGQLDAGSSPNG